MTASSRLRSLWPREHGAYAQLALPLLAALLVRTPTLPAGLFAIAAVGAFLANEPILVLLGHRGARHVTSDGPRSRRRLWGLAATTLVAGTAGIALANNPTLVVTSLAAIPAFALVGIATRGGQHTLVAELVAAVALPAAAAPVAVASGVAVSSAMLVWGAWALGYGASVIAVHRVIARHRRAAGQLDRAIAVALCTAIVIACVVASWFPIVSVVLPLLALSTALVMRPPRARHLRAIGIALVAASVASVFVAIVLV